MNFISTAQADEMAEERRHKAFGECISAAIAAAQGSDEHLKWLLKKKEEICNGHTQS